MSSEKDPVKKPRVQTYQEFWPFYLSEHSNRWNRALHFIGTTIALALLVTAIVTHQLKLICFAFLSGYGWAWVGHFIIEKNRPATFRYPLWSFVSDFKLWFFMLTGRKVDTAQPIRKAS